MLLAPDMLPFATALTCPPLASTHGHALVLLRPHADGHSELPQSRRASPTAGSGAEGDRGRQVKLRVRSSGGWSRCQSIAMSSRLSRLCSRGLSALSDRSRGAGTCRRDNFGLTASGVPPSRPGSRRCHHCRPWPPSSSSPTPRGTDSADMVRLIRPAGRGERARQTDGVGTGGGPAFLLIRSRGGGRPGLSRTRSGPPSPPGLALVGGAGARPRLRTTNDVASRSSEKRGGGGTGSPSCAVIRGGDLR